MPPGPSYISYLIQCPSLCCVLQNNDLMGRTLKAAFKKNYKYGCVSTSFIDLARQHSYWNRPCWCMLYYRTLYLAPEPWPCVRNTKAFFSPQIKWCISYLLPLTLWLQPSSDLSTHSTNRSDETEEKKKKSNAIATQKPGLNRMMLYIGNMTF